jgi:hypothetical protein
MNTKVVIRGDSYALRRPLFRYELVDIEGRPFDLAGCVLQTTYKVERNTPKEDPEDRLANVKHHIEVGADGEIIAANGMVLEARAQDGVILEYLTAVESRELPLDEPMFSDLELTDPLGEVFTFLFEGEMIARDGLTHRIYNRQVSV